MEYHPSEKLFKHARCVVNAKRRKTFGDYALEYYPGYDCFFGVFVLGFAWAYWSMKSTHEPWSSFVGLFLCSMFLCSPIVMLVSFLVYATLKTIKFRKKRVCCEQVRFASDSREQQLIRSYAIGEIDLETFENKLDELYDSQEGSHSEKNWLSSKDWYENKVQNSSQGMVLYS